uniref:Putative acyl-coa synthetase n=1 Tax=Ixodes scapularis TaxID=6945 RepID=A0A4D5RSU4_IXOSC
MFGLVFAGATLVLAKPSLTERELCYQMNDSDASHILTDPQNAPKALKLRSTLKLKRMFLMGEAPEFESVHGLSGLDENSYEEVEVPDPKNTIVVLSYTSGTTGLPKGVEVSHYGFVAHLHTSKNCLSSEDTDVLLAWNPITHASGFLFTMMAACTGSTCVVTSPALSFEKFVDLVNEHNVTTIASFPGRLQYVVNEMKRSGVRLDSIRKINVGGSVVSEALANGIRSVFENLRCLRNLYAMSESCGIVCSPAPNEINVGHLGYPAPMVELKFLDIDTGVKVGPHTPAELYFRIPSCMRGYYGRPEETAQFMDADGWCRSGDVAYYDEEGKVYFVERLKEMIR